MARKVLVLGGTRFFGKKLVHRLIQAGDEVTVASRNFALADFGSAVTREKVDREDEDAMAKLFAGKRFDVIHDQICYSPTAADILRRVAEGHAGALVHTSTQSVYDTDGRQSEDDFDPKRLTPKLGERKEFSYADGKRLAEAVYAANAPFPVTFVRLPFVLGPSDYTARLDFHIERVARGAPIVSRNPQARTSIIDEDEAARFIQWVGEKNIPGALNAASSGEISLSGILQLVERAVGSHAVMQAAGEISSHSPYAQSQPRYLDTSRAEGQGYVFSKIADWLPDLVRSRAVALSS